MQIMVQQIIPIVTMIYDYPVNIYLFKVNNKSTRKSSEICSKLTIKTQVQRQWHFLKYLL